jgi:hypothetical protein
VTTAITGKMKDAERNDGNNKCGLLEGVSN